MGNCLCLHQKQEETEGDKLCKLLLTQIKEKRVKIKI